MKGITVIYIPTGFHISWHLGLLWPRTCLD